MFKKRKIEQLKSIRLLTFWTWRYVLVLLGSLLVVAVIIGVWLRTNAYAQSLEVLEVRASQLAEMSEQLLSTNKTLDQLRSFKDIRTGRFIVQIMDADGHLRLISKGKYDKPANDMPRFTSSYLAVLRGETVEDQVRVSGEDWVRIGVPITDRNVINKGLFISLPATEAIPRLDRLYGLLAMLILSIALGGWLVIYFLSRKLTSPLLQIAQAARSIADGGYDPALPDHVKEQEMQQLVTSFRNMAQRLKTLEMMRTELLAGVSHELRTPITSIRGMIQAVKTKVVTDSEAEEFLQISFDETKRLQKMVEELLDFSSLEAGNIPLQMKPVNMNELVEEVIQQLSILPEFKDLVIERDLPAESTWALGDAGLLRQILLNLLNNSRQHSPAFAKIRIRLTEEPEQMMLDVQDQGNGIPEEEQPYIFERFYRGNSRHKKTRGLGLGLTISRLLARHHGGDLTLLESTPKGTTFRLTLPIS
ncbi:MAG: sensor histidine kinase [Tumebacillaceae bacterium]